MTDWLLRHHLIEREEAGWCQYMLCHRLMDIFSLLLLIPLGAAVAGWRCSALFFFTFRFLRARTGGYHAHTALGCLLCSSAAHLFFLSFALALTDPVWMAFLATSSAVTVLLLAPANNANLHLNAAELRAVIVRIRIRVALLMTVYIFSMWFCVPAFAACIASSFAATAFFLVLSRAGYGIQ